MHSQQPEQRAVQGHIHHRLEGIVHTQQNGGDAHAHPGHADGKRVRHPRRSPRHGADAWRCPGHPQQHGNESGNDVDPPERQQRPEHLRHERNEEQPPDVFLAVARVHPPAGDAEGVERVGNPAHRAQQFDIRPEHHPDVVDEHGRHRKRAYGVIGERLHHKPPNDRLAITSAAS